MATKAAAKVRSFLPPPSPEVVRSCAVLGTLRLEVLAAPRAAPADAALGVSVSTCVSSHPLAVLRVVVPTSEGG